MREYIVLANHDHYNHLGIVRTLGEAGIRPVVIAVHDDPPMATISRYTKKKHIVSSPEAAIRLLMSEYAKDKTEKSFILTGDDVSVMVLDSHYDELKDHFYFFNAGKTGRVKKYMNKDEIYALAEKHGFRVPKTWKVHTGDIPKDIEYPVITKATNSFSAEWKGIVFICRDDGELKNAYSKIKSEQVLLQKYISKTDEQSYEGISVNRGKSTLFIMQNNELYHIPDKYALYWKNKNVDDRDFIDRASKMIEEIGFEGIFEFEFMIGEDGEMYFLEINFRNTVNGWSTTVAGMPGVTLWCDAMRSGKIPADCRKPIPEGFTTMAECFDYDVRVKTGRIRKKEWWKQYKEADAKLYRGRHDLIPFFSFMWYKLTKMNRR